MLKNKIQKLIRIRFGLLVLSAGFFVSLFCARPAAAANYYCNSCSDCQNKVNSAASGDTIYVAQNIVDYSGATCISVANKNNITIDCNNGAGGKYFILSYGSGNNGIYLNNSDNSTIKNCTVSGFSYGLLIENSDGTYLINSDFLSNGSGIRIRSSNGNIFTNVNASYNSGNGITFDDASNNNSFSDITVNSNSSTGLSSGYNGKNNIINNVAANFNLGSGIEFKDDYSTLSDVVANGNGSWGIYIYNADYSTFNNIKTLNNSSYGVYIYLSTNNLYINGVSKFNAAAYYDVYVLSSASSNTFYGNDFVAKNRISDNASGNKWDSDNGDGVWQAGETGNHWDYYDENPDTDGSCVDAASPAGICDSAYTIKTGVADKFPKHIAAVSAFYCKDCSDCTSNISKAYAGSSIYLTKAVSNNAGDCLNFSNKQNLTFDCQGFALDGNNTGNGAYFYNNLADGLNTLQNCAITDFSTSVSISKSNKNIIKNNTIKSSYTLDASLSSDAANNMFYGNTFANDSKIQDNSSSTDWDNNAGTGNHWENFDAESEGCNNAGGYCAGGRTLYNLAVDQYPLYVGDTNQSTCNSCSDCQAKINSALSGTIKLTADIFKTTSTCLALSSKNNITFDCQGHIITGASKSNYGVSISGGSGNTVKNCIIKNFSYGVFLSSTNGNFLENITSFYNNTGFQIQGSGSTGSNTLTNLTGNKNADYGIYLSSSGTNNFNNITANYNEDAGIYLASSNSNTFISSTVYYNYPSSVNPTGIIISSSNSNTFRNSQIKYNPLDINITSSASSGNIFYDNEFISKLGISDSGTNTQWDNGVNSGNWWQAFDSNAELCVDNISPTGICDSAYPINASKQDRYPKWKRAADSVLTCSDCSDCTAKIASAQYGDYITVNADINGFSDTSNPCISLYHTNGITLDGGDKILDGNSGYAALEIKKYSRENKIKKFKITGFSKGIYVRDYSNYNTFIDNSVSYNSNGIYIDYSSSNDFTDTIASNNSSGIYMNYSSNNIFTNLISSANNSSGVYFANSNNNNTISNGEITGNGSDVYFYNTTSQNNTFSNNHLISAGAISGGGTGTIFSGNWWEAYDTGSEGCNDNDGNGICDAAYPVKTSPVLNDASAQYKGGTGTVYTCNSCSDCNIKIASAQYGDTVELTTDLFGTIGDCLTITNKKGIIFDCKDHIIGGNNYNRGLYIAGNYTDDHNNIKNCKFTKFSYGIYAYRTNRNTFDNIDSYNNSPWDYGYGIRLEESDYNIFTNLSIYKNNYYGLSFNSGSDYNEVSLSNIYENKKGIYLNSSGNNKFYTNTVKSNKEHNVYLDSGSGNTTFYNNRFASSEKIYTYSGLTGILWSSGGVGNWWENYDTPAEGCSDGNGDGKCDVKYPVTTGFYDDYPKYYGPVNDNYTCPNCSECNTAIENAKFGDKVTLSQDISNVDSCLSINYKEGLIFDCDYKTISGNGGGSSDNIGIKVTGSGIEKNTIKNCNIKGFAHGIYVDKSDYGTYQNINSSFNNCYVSNCTGNGFYMYANVTNLSNITVNNNEEGLYIVTGNSNNISGVTADNNKQTGNYYGGRGVYVGGGSNNYLSGVSASNNQYYGIYLTGNSSSLIYNANLQGNPTGLYINSSNNCAASSSIIKTNSTKDIKIESNSSNNKFYRNELFDRGTISDSGPGTIWDNGSDSLVGGGNHWELFDSATDCYMDGTTQICCIGSGLYCSEDGANNVYKIDASHTDHFPIKSPAEAQIFSCTSCSDCSAKISQAVAGDSVELSKDIIFQSGNCIDFGSKAGIIFDCKDHEIIGMNTGYGVYMHAPGNKFNTVKNCHISYFESGLYLADGSESNIFTDLTLSNHNYYGARLKASNYNQFSDVVITNSGQYGLYMYAGTYNIFNNITANNSNRGIYLEGSGYNTFSEINAYNNANEGIYIQSSKNNIITKSTSIYNKYGFSIKGGQSYWYYVANNNIISSSTAKWNTINDAYISVVNDPTYYNNTCQDNRFYDNGFDSAAKIYDNGYLTHWNYWPSSDAPPGNNWNSFDEDSEGCFDGNSDSICDNNLSPFAPLVYSLDADSTDRYPLRMTGLSNFYCNTCSDCQTKINSAPSGSVINAAADMTATTNPCLDLTGKTNLTIDCNNHTMTGNTGINGINAGTTGGHTIRNCVISTFSIGIALTNSSNNTITGNTFLDNMDNFGLRIGGATGSFNNTIYANNFTSTSTIKDTYSFNTQWDNAGAGNHWDDYDTPAEGCSDSNSDGICDARLLIVTPDNYDDFPVAVSVPSATECNSCSDCQTKINAASSGSTIKLINNITDVSGDCIAISNKTGVTFDCQNKIIDGVKNGKAIVLTNSTGNTIKNCYIARFDYGIFLKSGSHNNTIIDTAANYNDYHGIYIGSSNYTKLTRIEANNNGYNGIFSENSNYNNFYDVETNNNSANGISLSGSVNNNIDNAAITGNSYSGIYFSGSNNNYVANANIANNSLNTASVYAGLYFNSSDNNIATSSAIKLNRYNVYLDSNSNNNKFYDNSLTSKYKISDSAADNQWDNGAGKGNWWEAFDTDTECVSGLCCTNNSEICANAYGIKTGVSDRYPQYKGSAFNDQNKACSSCDDCSDKIQSAYYGEIIKLDTDTAKNSTCITFPRYKEGVAFDGQNHIIAGPASSGSYGVYVYGEGDEFNTIKNASIFGFERGVYIVYSDSIRIDNVKANFNTYNGFSLSYSNYAVLSNLTAENNGRGMDSVTANSSINGMFASGNYYGIQTYGDNNTLSSVTISNSQYTGLYLGASDYNTLYGGTYKNNQIDVSIDGSSNSNIFYDNAFTSADKISDNDGDNKWDSDDGDGVWETNETGNWWESFDGENELCHDDGAHGGTYPVASNSKCDEHFQVKTGVYDKYPIYKGSGYNNQNIACDSCSDCTEKIKNAYYGERVLPSQNLDSSGTCITFGNYSEGITFDCQNYALNGYGNNYGIYFTGYGNRNNKAANCVINNFNYGAYLQSDKNYLEGSTIGYSGYGVYFGESDYNNISNITLIKNQSSEIWLYRSNYNTIDNITTTDPGYSSCLVSVGNGIFISDNSSDNTIKNSIIKFHNTDISISPYASNNNEFYGNSLVSNTKINDNATTKWYNSATNTGNTWEAWDTAAEGCSDAVSPIGICDAPYQVKSGVYDNFPKYIGTSATTYCTDCSDCNAKIAAAQYGDKIILTQDIINNSGTCMTLYKKQGIILDGSGCAGGNCKIKGTGTGNGIQVCGTNTADDKIAIKNFQLISDFEKGIYSYKANNVSINNIESSYNTKYGLLLEYIASSTLLNIVANYNTAGGGVYLTNDSSVVANNILHNITANYNKSYSSEGGGIYLSGINTAKISSSTVNNNQANYSWGTFGGLMLQSSRNNIISLITASNNSATGGVIGGGITLYSSNNNQLYYATSTNNTNYGIYLNSSDNNTIASNTVQANISNYIYIDSNSNTNKFFSNNFNSRSDIYDGSSNTRWNNYTTVNVAPGNRWYDYDTFAEGCYDDGTHNGTNPIAFDGYCDDHYPVNTTYDEFPIKYSVMPADFNITNAWIDVCDVRVLWQNLGDADLYRIYRSENGGAFAYLANASNAANSFLDTNITIGSGYRYKVEAVNGQFSKYANCDRSGGVNTYCEQDGGEQTVSLYPIICATSLAVTTADDCATLDLVWSDRTPTNNYYIMRSVDGGTNYFYSCTGLTDPKFGSCATIRTITDDNSASYTFNDDDTATYTQFSYKIRNCYGTSCPGTTACEATASGPRVDCYVESNIASPTCSLPPPTWKEIKP